jgi:hypothetical protein
MSVFRARGGGMDRETLMDDLDLILERSRDELPGEWDWKPPLGSGAVAISASEPRDAAVGGPDDEAEDDADSEEEEEEEDEEGFSQT